MASALAGTVLATVLLSASATAAQDDDGLTISVWTMSPGNVESSVFGHSVVVVRDHRRQRATAYNFGVFNYGPGFIIDFLKGSMIFWGEPKRADKLFQKYAKQDRKIWEQELNLSATQKQKLVAHLRKSVRKEFREYKYDYFKDNCATRIRESIDLVAGDPIKFSLSDRYSGTTFRDHVRRMTDPSWLAYVGLNALLGTPSDKPISAFDEMFVPDRFRDLLREVEVTHEDGSKHRLVREEKVIRDTDRAMPLTEPPPFQFGFLGVGVLWAALIAMMAVPSRKRWIRMLLSLPTVAWGLACGVLGALLTHVLFTDHYMMHWNENLLFLNPLCFAYVVLAPVTAWKDRSSQWMEKLSLVLLAGAAITIVAMLFEATRQESGEWLAFAVPGHATLYFVMRRLRLRNAHE